MIEFASVEEYESARIAEDSGIREGRRTRSRESHRAAETLALRGFGLCEGGSPPRPSPRLRRSRFRQGENSAASRRNRKGHAAPERFETKHPSDSCGLENVRGREETASRRKISLAVRRDH